MNREYLPSLLMLTAGAVTCIITFIRRYSTAEKLLSLLAVMLLFYFLGNVLKWTLNHFEMQNEKKRKEEGEVIEKEAAEAEQEEEEAEADAENGQA